MCRWTDTDAFYFTVYLDWAVYEVELCLYTTYLAIFIVATQIQLITTHAAFIYLFFTTTHHIRPIGTSLHSSLQSEGTLIDLLMKRFPEVDGQKQFGFSVSHTTRDPRPGEEDGVAYNFTTVEAIKKEIDAGKFLEYAEVQ